VPPSLGQVILERAWQHAVKRVSSANKLVQPIA
jgi:hypothetical protein